MDLGGIVVGLAAKAAEKSRAEEGDYILDELLYCGKCHTAKQCRVNFLGREVTLPCICKCEAERQLREEEETKRRELEMKIEKYRALGFKESSMREWTFANDDMADERTTKIMMRYVENFPEFRKNGKGLLLYGKCGTGKTYAACEVANALIEKGYPCLVTNFSRIVKMVSGFGNDKQEYLDSLNRFALLVLDDLGAERNTEYMDEQIFNIIDSRYRAGLPMIITTNLSLNDVKNPKSEASERIYDRIIERCMPVEVNGANRRRKIVCRDYGDMKDMLGL